MKNRNGRRNRRAWAALGLCCCMTLLAGCAETSKTIVLAPTPTPQAEDAQTQSCQYDVSRIDRPQIENGIAAYNWIGWYTKDEHAILCGGYDVDSGAAIIERMDYRYGFHETIVSITAEQIDRTTGDIAIAPDGSKYALAEESDGQSLLSLYEMGAETPQPKVQTAVDTEKFGTLMGVEWSGDSTTCLAFFQKTQWGSTEQPVDATGQAAPSGGTVQQPIERTDHVYALVCTMEGAVGQEPVEIPLPTQAPVIIASDPIALSMDGRVGMLQGYNVVTGENQSYLFAFNQPCTAIEKHNVLGGFYPRTAWLGTDTMMVADGERLFLLSDIWNTAEKGELSAEKTVSQKTDVVIAPNGKAVAFGQMDKNNQWDIYIGVVNEDGTLTQKIAYKGAEWIYQLSFSPDSTRLLVQTEQPYASQNDRKLMIIEFK